MKKNRILSKQIISKASLFSMALAVLLGSCSDDDGAIELLNETESPSENVTLEVAEEDEEHQFFFDIEGALMNVDYADEDGNGNPLGINFTLTTGDAGNGSMLITLKHEPKKPNDGTLADAGGETDIAQRFSVTVE